MYTYTATCGPSDYLSYSLDLLGPRMQLSLPSYHHNIPPFRKVSDESAFVIAAHIPIELQIRESEYRLPVNGATSIIDDRRTSRDIRIAE